MTMHYIFRESTKKRDASVDVRFYRLLTAREIQCIKRKVEFKKQLERFAAHNDLPDMTAETEIACIFKAIEAHYEGRSNGEEVLHMLKEMEAHFEARFR